MYVMRTGLANSTYALHKSVIDDYVDSTKRSCWNSVEFIFVLGWSGSAVFGGWLIKSIGYQYTFVITLILAWISITMYFLLIPLVVKKEHYLGDIKGIGGTENTENTEDTAPLIQNIQ